MAGAAAATKICTPCDSSDFESRSVELRIGDQLIDLIDGGDLKIGDDTPLAVVRHNDDLSLRMLDHLPYDLGFVIGGHRTAVPQR